MTASAIEYRGVAMRFLSRGEVVTACQGVDLEVREGEFIALVGPSGCGKSTLLNMAAGLLRPTSGEVWYRGEPIADVNTRVGYMSQRDTLLPWRTALDNVALSLEFRRHSKKESQELAYAQLEMVGLKGFEASYPSQLSGGMRRRVVLARTLAYDPETILMDEPFGAVDAQMRMVLHAELLRVWSATRKTVLFVTHDLAEAITLADRVAVFTSRPGRIKVVEPVTLSRPRDVFSVHFTEEFGVLHRRLWGHLEDASSAQAKVAG